MADYANGEIPLSVLIAVPGQEDDDAYLSATTSGRWLALKQDVLATYGVTIWIVPGYNAYRPLANQVYAKNIAIAEGRPQDAADPGTSSHGGRYIQPGSSRNGDESLAIDVGGYEVLNRDDWYAMCRKHGFEPGFFDWEPWHIIDWDPQIGVPAATGSASTPAATKTSEEDDMYAIRQAGVPNSGIIIRPGVPPYSLPDQVFEAEASTYGLTIKELPDWRYGTAVREQWTAFNTAERYRADAKLSQDSIAEVASKVRDELGGVITPTTAE